MIGGRTALAIPITAATTNAEPASSSSTPGAIREAR